MTYQDPGEALTQRLYVRPQSSLTSLHSSRPLSARHTLTVPKKKISIPTKKNTERILREKTCLYY